MKTYQRLGIIGTALLITGTAFAQENAFSQAPFTDVKSGTTYFEGIEYLRTHNVLKGYLDGTFKPETRINRAEFIMFVINPLIMDTNNLSACIQTSVPASSSFIFYSDVARDAWYADQLCFAKMKHLVDGYPDGTYKPADYINFVEASKIIANVFSIDIGKNETGEFWYRPYVKRLSDLRAIPASIKRFDQTITRGEMAEMVYRLKADRTDKASASFGDIR